jgi:serine/threonine protein kinase
MVMPATLRPLKTRYAHLGESAVFFLESCLAGNPSERLSAAQLLSHPWLAEQSQNWQTPEFLKAREREKNSLVHRCELVVRRQRMQLTTAQVLQLPPQSNNSSSAAPKLASSKLRGFSAHITADATGSYGSSATNTSKFAPRRLATSTGVATSSGSGSGATFSKRKTTGSGGVTSWPIPRINDDQRITDNSASNVGDGMQSQHHRSIINNATTGATSATPHPPSSQVNKASPYLTRGSRQVFTNTNSGSMTSAGILRPPAKTPTKRSAHTRSQDEVPSTRSTLPPASRNGTLHGSAAGFSSSGGSSSLPLPPSSRRHVIFKEEASLLPPSRGAPGQINSNEVLSTKQPLQDAVIHMTTEVPAVATTESAAASAQTPRRNFLSRLMHGSKREVKLKSPERGVKRSGLSNS